MNQGDMAQLTNTVAGYLPGPVEDPTGLKGHYGIEIKISNDAQNDELDRLSAFREALTDYGLRLAAAKIDAPIRVIEPLQNAGAELGRDNREQRSRAGRVPVRKTPPSFAPLPPLC